MQTAFAGGSGASPIGSRHFQVLVSKYVVFSGIYVEYWIDSQALGEVKSFPNKEID
jgi:hypothetical protein